MTSADVAGCLTRIAQGDPMVTPVEVGELCGLETFAAVVEDRAVVGVGWRRPIPQGTVVEVRVEPGHRRRGIGSALLARLAEGHETLLASCDAGHPRTRRFVERRGFQPLGVVFHQRWDGTPGDVAGAFRTARAGVEEDPGAAAAVLAEASADSWPPPALSANDLSRPGMLLRTAWLGDRRAGVLAAMRSGDALAVMGLAVLAADRRRGIGRMLLTDLMRAAAEQELGVVLHIDAADESLVEWTRALGFWTYRSWAWYERPKLT